MVVLLPQAFELRANVDVVVGDFIQRVARAGKEILAEHEAATTGNQLITATLAAGCPVRIAGLAATDIPEHRLIRNKSLITA